MTFVKLENSTLNMAQKIVDFWDKQESLEESGPKKKKSKYACCCFAHPFACAIFLGRFILRQTTVALQKGGALRFPLQGFQSKNQLLAVQAMHEACILEPILRSVLKQARKQRSKFH